jgi:hypothetical protein
MFTYSREGGIIHNFSETSSFPEVKPPRITTGTDRWGSYTVITGTESLTALTVKTTAAPLREQTTVGDTIYFIGMSPSFLSNTRMRLLMENYERYRFENLQIRYQPLGDATLGGGLVMVPLTDPDTILSIGNNGAQKVSRAMDYANSVNFNIYNHALMHFPKHPEDQEPYFMISGHNARLEIPYAFQVLAQTTFQDSNGESQRDVGWLRFDYEVRLYDPRLPEMSVENVSQEENFQSVLFSDLFDTSSVQINWPVIGNTDTPEWILDANTSHDKVAVLTVLEDFMDTSNNVLQLQSNTHGGFTMSRGLVLFYKTHWEDVIMGTKIRFYTNLDNLFLDNDGVTWDVAPNSASTMTSGRARIDVYDFDHIL